MVGDARALLRKSVEGKRYVTAQRPDAVHSRHRNESQSGECEKNSGIEMPRGRNIAMQKGVYASERAAACTVISGQQARRTLRIETCREWVEIIQHDSGDGHKGRHRNCNY